MEGMKERKLVLKCRETVPPTQEDCLGVRLLIFTSNSNFQTTLYLPNLLFLQILPIL